MCAEGRRLHVVSILKHKEITCNAENRFMNVIERKENNYNTVQGCTLDWPPLAFSSTPILRNPDHVNRVGLGSWIGLTREPLMEVTVMGG